MAPSTLFLTAAFAFTALAQIYPAPTQSATVAPPGTTISNVSTSASAATTLNLFLDSYPSNRFAGSIVAADACDTTIAIACTSVDYGFDGNFEVNSCDGSQSGLATYYGSTAWSFSSAVQTNTLGADVTATVTESCSLQPTSSAVCSYYISGSAENGENHGKVKTSSSATYDGAQAADKWFQVPITAGASKLPAEGVNRATCTAPGNQAAPIIGAREAWKVVVVPGAAALLAGAL